MLKILIDLLKFYVNILFYLSLEKSLVKKEGRERTVNILPWTRCSTRNSRVERRCRKFG